MKFKFRCLGCKRRNTIKKSVVKTWQLATNDSDMTKEEECPIGYQVEIEESDFIRSDIEGDRSCCGSTSSWGWFVTFKDIFDDAAVEATITKEKCKKMSR